MATRLLYTRPRDDCDLNPHRSAVVFATDSKLTTYGRVGFDTAGKPIIVPQTYDNATKIVRLPGSDSMAAVAGSVNLGTISVMDYCATSALALHADPAQQDQFVRDFADGIATLREAYWNPVDEKDWPDTALLLASPTLGSRAPIVWHVEFTGRAVAMKRITNRVYMEGSYRGVFPLLYGYDASVLGAVGQQLGVDPKAIGDALDKITVLKPIEKLNVEVMPVQDAMDLAFFLAKTQIEMERFLPGEAACGGPIDIMVLKTSPTREIIFHPGKVERHPAEGYTGSQKG